MDPYHLHALIRVGCHQHFLRYELSVFPWAATIETRTVYDYLLLHISLSQSNVYEEVIEAAFIQLASERNEVDWDVLLNYVQENIVQSYSGTNLVTFRGIWKRRVSEVASDKNMRLINESGSKNTWKALFSSLKEKRKSQQASTTVANKRPSRNNLLSADRKAKF